MFQIKLTKPIKPSRSNRTTISRKTDPNRYASILIITKPISIGSVTNLEKNRANGTMHTPTYSYPQRLQKCADGTSIKEISNMIYPCKVEMKKEKGV